MKQLILVKLEAFILIVIGLSSMVFTLSASYPALMNPKFKLLTLIGAALVLGLGIAGLRRKQPCKPSGAILFLLFMAIVVLGKPWTQGGALMAPELSEFGGFDDPDYPMIDLKKLQRAVEENKWPIESGFSALGMIKSLPEDEQQSGTITLMRNYMVCCAADAVAYGFRLNSADLSQFTEGEWIVVSGILSPLPEPDPVSPFRLGTATFSVVGPEHYIEAKRILSSNVLLPSLQGQLSSEQLELFHRGLKLTGLWETLAGDEPYTLFAPVNQAMEAAGYGSFDQPLSDDERRELATWLSRHIVPGKIPALDLYDYEILTTLNQNTLTVNAANGRILIEKSRILFKDQNARNGIIHLIYPALEINE